MPSPPRAAFPRHGRLAERRGHLHALHPDLRDGAGRLHRRRGLADLVPVQVQGPPRPRGGPDPRQHAAGDRLDRRRRRGAGVHHGRHLHQAAGDQEPAGVARSTLTATRSPRNAFFASTDQKPPPKGRHAEHHRRRPAVRVALPVPAGRQERLRLRRTWCARRHDRHPRHHVRRRRPLVVDPEARRQDGRGPRATSTRPGSRPPRSAPTAASAPSCAGATTPT